MRSLALCAGNNIGAVLPLAASEGLGIEMQAFYHPDILDHPADALAEHRRLLAGFDGARALHGPLCDLCPGSVDPLVRKVTGHRFAQAFAIARKLAVPEIILHHGYVPNTTPPAKWVATAAGFWAEALPGLPDGARVHLENLLDESPDVLLQLVERVADPQLGICLDIGHAHALSRTPVVEWVRKLGPALTYCHLHDNGGARDDHLPLGQGNVPLRVVLEALERHAPAAIWAVEADAEPSLAWLRENGFLPPRAES